MVFIASHRPCEEFFRNCLNRDEYLDSIDYFIFDSEVTKQNVFEKESLKLLLHNAYLTVPLYCALMSDSYFYKRDPSNPSVSIYKAPDCIPEHLDASPLKGVLPAENRRYRTMSALENKLNELLTVNYKEQKFREIVL